MARSSLLWDDPLCPVCDAALHDLARGSMTLQDFVERFQEKPSLDASRTTPPQIVKEQRMRCSSVTDEHEVHGRHLGAGGLATLPLAGSTDGFRHHKGNAGNGDHVPACARAVLEPEHVPAGDWRQVRDALLTWEGEGGEDVAACRHMVCGPWLRMWLRAHREDAALATQAAMRHFRWRAEFGTDGVADEDWAEHDKRGEMYVSGVDREGNPSWTWRTALHDASLATPEEGTRYLIATLERVWRVNPTAESMVVILDCTGTQYNNYEHAMCLMCNALLSQNYPDQMKISLMFPVNWVIKGLVTISRGVLDEVTVSKLRLVEEDEVLDTLREFFDDDQIEARFGGKLDLSTPEARRAAAARRLVGEGEAMGLGGGVKGCQSLTERNAELSYVPPVSRGREVFELHEAASGQAEAPRKVQALRASVSDLGPERGHAGVDKSGRNSLMQNGEGRHLRSTGGHGERRRKGKASVAVAEGVARQPAASGLGAALWVVVGSVCLMGGALASQLLAVVRGGSRWWMRHKSP